MKIKLSNESVIDFPIIMCGDKTLMKKLKFAQKLLMELSGRDSRDDGFTESYLEADKAMNDLVESALDKSDYESVPVSDVHDIASGIINGYDSMDDRFTNFTGDASPQS